MSTLTFSRHPIQSAIQDLEDWVEDKLKRRKVWEVVFFMKGLLFLEDLVTEKLVGLLGILDR